MKFDNKIILIFLLVCLSGLTVRAQEFLVSPGRNPIHKGKLQDLRKKNVNSDTLKLPFRDDFSTVTEYPDDSLWSDNQVYINSNFPVSSPSWQVATLDAMDSTGTIYKDATVKSFLADVMTSRPIDLFYPLDTTVYLSFYYQPQGFGDAPEPDDSLVLEFYAPDMKSWKRVWSKPGSEVYDFRIAMVNITDSRFLQKGFRFRFRNYASLAPAYEASLKVNADQWHIDYVYLNKGRRYNDTIMKDLSLIEPVGSLLLNHTAIPWEHFRQIGISAVKTIFPLSVRNLSGDRRIYEPVFRIESVYSPASFFEKKLNADEIKAFEILKYDATFNYGFTSNERDSAEFKIILDLNQADPDWIPGNDKTETRQVFSDYYAYDDGSAEAGYGLVGEGTRTARVAYRFQNFYPGDSLVGIRIYFNRTFADANKKYFTVAVWTNDNNLPGEMIYQQEGGMPRFDGINEFQTIMLDTAQTVNGKYYIGWLQTTTDFLNVGFDRQNNHRTDILYNLSGTWKTTGFDGALMIRPVFSNKSTKSGMDQEVTVPRHAGRVSFYPNPAGDLLYFKFSEPRQDVRVAILDSRGRLVLQKDLATDHLSTANLPDGLYFIRIWSGSEILLGDKLIVLHE